MMLDNDNYNLATRYMLRIRGNISSNTWINSLADGSAFLPSHTFANSVNTGMYHAGNGTLALSSNGTQIATFTANTATILANVLVLPQGNIRASTTSVGQIRVNTLFKTPELSDGARWYQLDKISQVAPIDALIAVDAENSASYPGTGNTWSSLVYPQINGTKTANVTYVSGNPSYLNFSGTDSYVDFQLSNPAGAWAHSVSCWFQLSVNQSALTGTYYTLFSLGNVAGTSQLSSFGISNDSLNWYFYANDTSSSYNAFEAGKWYHIALTYNGGDASIINKIMYINGVPRPFYSRGGSGALNIAANTILSIGRERIYGAHNPFPGKISQFQLWNRALSENEVVQLYKSEQAKFIPTLDMAVSNLSVNNLVVGPGSTVGTNYADATSLDIVGAFRPGFRITDETNNFRWLMYNDPNNTLVLAWVSSIATIQGKIYVRPDAGVILDNFTGHHRTFVSRIPSMRAPEMQGLIVSSDTNTYIQMSGGTSKGKSAITIDESLPVVSLASKAYDKACFGVISGAEEEHEQRVIPLGGGIEYIYPKTEGDTRIYINSLGEGAIWVSDAGGPLESGDYITTSEIPGYGQRQESEFLANYTVAKITMDCTFNPSMQPAQQIKRVMGTKSYYISSHTEISENEYNQLPPEEQSKYERITRKEMVNSLDEYGQIQWEDALDENGRVISEMPYEMRYLTPDGTVLTKEEYQARKDEGESVFRAAFVGCTYHCG